jgi:hypothetical protein
VALQHPSARVKDGPLITDEMSLIVEWIRPRVRE